MGEMTERPRPTTSIEAINEFDLKNAMMGTHGNPTYEEQFGVTNAPTGETPFGPQPSIAELELAARQAEARALDPMGYMQGPPQLPQGGDLATLQAQLDEFKHKYGASENEKGEIRRQHAELMEAFNGLMSQYQALQSGPGPQSWNSPSPVPQYETPQYTAPAGNPFEGVGDDDVVQGKQVKQIIAAVAQDFMALRQQTQSAVQRQAQLERQLAAQAKASSGITPVDEWRLLAKNPWLQGLPDANRLAAMQALRQAEKAAQPPAPTPPAPQTAATQDRILSKVTYVEGSRPNVPDNSEAAINAAYERDYAKVMALPVDPDNVPRGQMHRADGLRWLAQKYNLNFAKPPSDLAR